jgi:uncharacterized protein (DUF1697 family)
VSTYVALLRAVNVGGTGKLPMAELRRIAQEAGLTGVRTYIASGNLVCSADTTPGEVADVLERGLREYAGRPVGVIIRTPAQLRSVLDGSPFPQAPGNRVAVVFLPDDPPADALSSIRNRDQGEDVQLGESVLYIHYPNGMGASKLVVPAAAAGTARNLNTVRALVELTSS